MLNDIYKCTDVVVAQVVCFVIFTNALVLLLQESCVV